MTDLGPEGKMEWTLSSRCGEDDVFSLEYFWDHAKPSKPPGSRSGDVAGERGDGATLVSAFNRGEWEGMVADIGPDFE